MKLSIDFGSIILVLCLFFAAFAAYYSPSLNSIGLYVAIPLASLLTFQKFQFNNVNKSVKLLIWMYVWNAITYIWAVDSNAASTELHSDFGAVLVCYIFAMNAKKEKLIPWLYMAYVILYMSAWNYARTHILVDMGELGAQNERLNDEILNANTMAYYTFYVSFAFYIMGEIIKEHRMKQLMKYLFIAMIPISFVVAILTASRQVLVIQVPLMSVFLYLRYVQYATNTRKFLFLFIAVATLFCVYNDVMEIYSNSYLSTRSQDSAKDDIRRFLMEDALHVGFSNFFTGVGAGCYCTVSKYGLFSHSTYFELFANTGILGVSLFMSSLWCFLKTQLKRFRQTKDNRFLVFLFFGVMFVFDNFFFVFHFSVWLMGIFTLVASQSDSIYKSEYQN